MNRFQFYTQDVNGVTVPVQWTPFVQIGIGDSRVEEDVVGQWDVDEWDDAAALWAGSEPFWLDITDKVFDTETFYGRERTTDLFDPGTATVFADNSDGWADPVPPDDDPALLTLRAGRRIRIGVTHPVAGEVTLWGGYIDSVEPRYDAGDFEAVEISAVCALGEVGRTPLAELAVPTGSGELAGNRVARILNGVRWPIGMRSIETTGVTILETVLGDEVANLLATVAESVGGAVYGDEQGRVIFRGRDWQVHQPDDPVDATIGNGVPHEIPWVEDPPGSGLGVVDEADWVEDPPGSGLYEFVGAG